MSITLPDGRRTRDLRSEAQVIAADIRGFGGMVRVRESRSCRSTFWSGFEVHHKADGDRAGKAVVTLVHLLNTVFV